MITLPNWLNRFRRQTAGGGGGGGVSWSLIASTSVAGTTGNTQVTIDATGGNLLAVAFDWSGGSAPTLTDSTGDTLTQAIASTFGGGNPKARWYYKISPTSGSHTITVPVAGISPHVHVYVFNKSGGTPVFHSGVDSGQLSGNWGSTSVKTGSITPATATSLFLSSAWWDTAGTLSPNCDSSFVKPNSSTFGGGAGIQTAYKIKADSLAENVTWTPGGSSNADANGNLIDFN